MSKLYLIRHMVGLPATDYHSFTVKGGAWFGVVKTPFGSIPAAWSGWTCAGSIYLYTLTATGWRARWYDETLFASVLDDLPIVERSGVVVLGEPDEAWFGEDRDEIPFFAIA